MKKNKIQYLLSKDEGSKGIKTEEKLQVICRKPRTTEFFRVFNGEDYIFGPVSIVEYGNMKEIYIVSPDVKEHLLGDFSTAYLVACMSSTGQVFVWAVKTLDRNGRNNGWFDSAWQAVEVAKDRWVKLKSNFVINGYDLIFPQVDQPDPEWSSETMDSLVEQALGDRIIDRSDHEIIKKLKGVIF